MLNIEVRHSIVEIVSFNPKKQEFITAYSIAKCLDVASELKQLGAILIIC